METDMNYQQAIKEFLREPASWAGLDEETRHLLRQQRDDAATVTRKDHSREASSRW